MNAEDYHKSLEPLKEACRLAGWACVTCPLTGGKARILFRHLCLIFKIYKIRRRRILLREFSTLPLLFVFPLLWPLRKHVRFLINHNLQWAVRNPLERFGLVALAKLGARWALFETQNFQPLEKQGGEGSAFFQGLEKFNIPSERNLVLPHPVLTSPPMEGCPTASAEALGEGRKGGGGSPVIGVAGYYRPEKGMDDLVRLLKEKVPGFCILLGVPNPEDAAHLDVETVSTASDEDYFSMIARCDVLIFNNGKENYFYRASGPVADAAACGTAVVVPAFPILGKQAAGVGEVFQGLENLPRAVETAVEKARAEPYDFKEYCRVRSARVIAKQLEDFTRVGS